jgi:hypothetical protein
MSGFDPLEILRTLNEHGVQYLAIGGLAATLYGSPLTTGDLDICAATDRENLERLAAALEALDAAIHTTGDPEGVPFVPDAAFLGNAEVWNLITSAGRLDVSFTPAGTTGYPDLVRDSVRFELGDVDVPSASLRDVIRSKEAAGRERDRQALPTLRRLLATIESQERSE